MPVTNTVDEVVNERPAGALRGLPARSVQEETVSVGGGAAKVIKSGIEDETHDGRGRQRVLKESTTKLLEKFEKEPAPHEEGDPDEDADGNPIAGEDDDAGEADGEPGDDAGGDEGEPSDAGDDDEGAEGDGKKDEEGDEATPDLIVDNQRLAARNRELLSELEEARKTPKAERTEREAALSDALDAYYEGGSVAAFRKFIGVVVGAAPDSKEVDAELSGVFLDLSEREVGVPLDPNQRSLRDNAKTRLLLARDKRDKADAAKKPIADNSADIGIEYGTRMIDGLLTTKEQGGTSIADEYPMLMALSEQLDGYKPAEVLARAIKAEVDTGTLNPKLSDIELIRSVAPKIEKHYGTVAQRINAATVKNTKTDTTKPSVKPKVAKQESTEQRQSTGARTLTNATASRAPANPPKTTTKPKATSEKKTRKDFPSDAAWREHLLTTHFPK